MGYCAVLLSVALFEDRTLFQNAPDAPPQKYTHTWLPLPQAHISSLKRSGCQIVFSFLLRRSRVKYETLEILV